MTMIRMDRADGASVAALWEKLSDEDLVSKMRRIWAMRWLEQPYLVETAGILHRWLEDELNPRTLAAVRRVVVTVLRAGLLDVTGSEDPARRCDDDVLGVVLTLMRAAGARAALGELHTPPDVAELIACIAGPKNATSELPPRGETIADPAAGTGGLIRAAAESIRRLGGDPAEYGWFLCDINPLAAACSAANAITWGLGIDVLVHCGDTLAEGDGYSAAAEARARVLEHYRAVVRTAQLAALAISPGRGVSTAA